MFLNKHNRQKFKNNFSPLITLSSKDEELAPFDGGCRIFIKFGILPMMSFGLIHSFINTPKSPTPAALSRAVFPFWCR